MTLKDRVWYSIIDWRDRLGLSEWDIKPGDPEEWVEHGEWAYVLHDDTEYKATVSVRPDASPGDVENRVLHELLHLLFVDMQFAACTGASTETMDQYERAQERVINRLVYALTNRS